VNIEDTLIPEMRSEMNGC